MDDDAFILTALLNKVLFSSGLSFLLTFFFLGFYLDRIYDIHLGIDYTVLFLGAGVLGSQEILLPCVLPPLPMFLCMLRLGHGGWDRKFVRRHSDQYDLFLSLFLRFDLFELSRRSREIR